LATSSNSVSTHQCAQNMGNTPKTTLPSSINCKEPTTDLYFYANTDQIASSSLESLVTRRPSEDFEFEILKCIPCGEDFPQFQIPQNCTIILLSINYQI